MLTLANNEASLALPLSNEAAVIGVTESHGIGRKHAVFLCVKSQFFIMSSWVERSKDWLGRVSSTPILLMLGSIIGVMWSGLKTLHTEAIMPNHTPKPNNRITLRNSVSNKSQSFFNLLARSGRSIARKVSFKTAINLKAGHPELIIKFDSMGAQS